MPQLRIQDRFLFIFGPRACLRGITMVAIALVLIDCGAVSPKMARSDPLSGAVKTAVSSGGPFKRVGALVGKSGYGDLRGDPIFSGNSRRFIALSNEKPATVRVWDVATLKPLCDPLPDPGELYGLSFDGKIAFTTDDHSVRFWNVDSSQLICTTKVTDGDLYAVAISPDGSQFLTQTKGEPGLKVWRIGETRPWFLIKQDAIECRSVSR